MAASLIPPCPDGALRLITFNLQHGMPEGGWGASSESAPQSRGTSRLARARRGLHTPRAHAEYVLSEAARGLAALQPDIVLLQEVDRSQYRSGNLDQARYIASALGMPTWHMGAAFAGHVVGRHRRPVARNLPGGRGYGLALLSRFPTAWCATRELEGKKLARVVQTALLTTPFGHIAVANTHLETQRTLAYEQTRAAWRIVASIDADSCLLAGDFNLSPAQVAEALAVLKRTEGPSMHLHIPSFPASAPAHSIDQLLASGWRNAGGPQAVRLACSDHCAVIYDLEPAPSSNMPTMPSGDDD